MTDLDKNTANSDSPLPPEAQRALKEAALRREKLGSVPSPREINGRGGLDPARYGDWEIKGILADF